MTTRTPSSVALGATSWCELDLNALQHNFDLFASLVGGPSGLLPVIKANAYGHGLEAVASVLVARGVEQVGVNELAEGLWLRERYPELDIIVLGQARHPDIETLVSAKLQLVAVREDALRLASAAAVAHGTIARVHLKLETGAHRQGLSSEALLPLARLLRDLPCVEFEGLSTHFAYIEDTTDPSFARQQLARFKEGVAALAAEGIRPRRLHAANTAATLNMPETRFDLARVGIGLYGLWPSQETLISAMSAAMSAGAQGGVSELRPVLSWKTRVVELKTVPAGGYIGYGRSFRATSPLRLAVLPVGYYDGYDRGLSNLAHVLIRGQRAPLRGRVCMNMCMVDVTDVQGVTLDDEVVLLGRSGDEQIRAEDLASLIGTIHYEVTTRIHERLPRILSDARAVDPENRAPKGDP